MCKRHWNTFVKFFKILIELHVYCYCVSGFWWIHEFGIGWVWGSSYEDQKQENSRCVVLNLFPNKQCTESWNIPFILLSRSKLWQLGYFLSWIIKKKNLWNLWGDCSSLTEIIVVWSRIPVKNCKVHGACGFNLFLDNPPLEMIHEPIIICNINKINVMILNLCKISL
jgi:hypothetical protein